jgi:hypothetical protein
MIRDRMSAIRRDSRRASGGYPAVVRMAHATHAAVAWRIA